MSQRGVYQTSTPVMVGSTTSVLAKLGPLPAIAVFAVILLVAKRFQKSH